MKLRPARRPRLKVEWLEDRRMLSGGAGSDDFGDDFDQAAFYAGRLNFEQLARQQGVTIDPRFLKANGYQFPVQARFGVKFLF